MKSIIDKQCKRYSKAIFKSLMADGYINNFVTDEFV